MEDIQPIALAALSRATLQPQPDPITLAVQPQHVPQHAQHGLPQLGPQHAQHYPNPVNLAPPHPTDDSTAADAATSPVGAALVTQGTLIRLHALFSQQNDTKLRHLSFMLLSRLGGLPPTLYRPSEEPEPAGAQGQLLRLHCISPCMTLCSRLSKSSAKVICGLCLTWTSSCMSVCVQCLVASRC